MGIFSRKTNEEPKQQKEETEQPHNDFIVWIDPSGDNNQEVDEVIQ